MALEANTVVLTVLAVSTAVSAYYTHADKQEAKKDRKLVAAKAEQVKLALDANTKENMLHREQSDKAQQLVQKTLIRIAAVSDDAHVLVNNNMAIQLNLTAVSARALANLTKDAEHQRLAIIAESALADHMRKQAKVDAAVKARENS